MKPRGSIFASQLSKIVIIFTSLLLLSIIGIICAISYTESIKQCRKTLENKLEQMLEATDARQRMADWQTAFFNNNIKNGLISDYETAKRFMASIPLGHMVQGFCFLPLTSWLPEDSVSIQYIWSNGTYNSTERHLFDFSRKDYEKFMGEISNAVDTSLWIGPYRLEFPEGSADFVMYLSRIKDSTGQTAGFCEVYFLADKKFSTKTFSELAPNSIEIYVEDWEQINQLLSETLPDGIYLANSVKNMPVRDEDLMTVSLSDSKYVYVERNLAKSDLSLFARLGNGWIVNLTFPFEVLFKQTKIFIISALILLAVGLVVMYFSVKGLIFRRTRPLTDFCKAANDIANGDFHTALPQVPNRDEVSLLRDSLDNMQVSLRKLTETMAANTRMESELTIAADIQKQLLKKEFPSSDIFDLYAYMQPAREVGGDLYDFHLKGDNLWFIVGDVSGKGVPASLLMAVTVSLFRNLTGKENPRLDETVANINDAIAYGNEKNMFLTLLIGKIDLKTLEMSFCNAGHTPMLIIGSDGEARYVKAKTNSICGVFEGLPFEAEKIRLQAGDRILVYTDGVNEAMNSRFEMFGENRLLEWASGMKEQHGMKKTVESIVTTVKKFTGNAEQSDDITILGIGL